MDAQTRAGVWPLLSVCTPNQDRTKNRNAMTGPALRSIPQLYISSRFASLSSTVTVIFFATRTDETRCEKFAVDRSLSLINRESGSKLAAQKIRANRRDSNCSTKDSFVRKQWPRSVLLKGSIDNSKRFEENSSKNNS